MKGKMKKSGKKLLAILCAITMIISCFQGLGSAMSDVKASDNTYTELTFSDFGIADQSFSSTTTGVAGKPSADIKSLDKTILTGKITLSRHVDEHILIGGVDGASDYNASSPGIIISQYEGGQLLIRAQYDGIKGIDSVLFNEEAPANKGFNMLGDTITFRIQLDYVGEDVVVTMTMDNGTVSVVDSATLTGIASKMTTNMAFNPWVSDCSIASVVNYTEVTFSDFGIDNQSFTSTTTGVKGTLPSTKTSWNKTIFTGKLQVTKNIGTHFIFGGSNTAGDYTADTQGLILEYRSDGQLLLRWQNSSSSKGAEHLLFDDNLLTSQGFNMLEDELVFRIQFDYFGADVTVTVTLDNGEVSATDKATFTGIASSMTTNMVFNPWVSDCSIASVVNYMEVTFSDFGIDNQSFTGTTAGVKGTLPSTKTSWNKTIFTGKLQVTKNIGTHFIFGGSDAAGDYTADTQGLILEYRTDGQLLLRWQNSSSSKGTEHLLFDDNLLTSQGFNMLGDELVFRIQFDYFGEDVTVTVTLDNGEVSATDKATFVGIASGMTTNMVFNPWVSDCKISSVNTSEEPDEPVAVERTLTFSDFGIDDANYNGGNFSALTGTAPADVKTLDKVTFIGKIGVTTNVDASLFFGGEYVNNAYQDDSYGIGFFNAAGELWLRYRWAGATSKEIKIISAENLSEQGLSLVGDELIWKVRFDYTDNDVKVTVTLQQGEDSVSGECTLEGIADTLKTNMAFNPWGSTCKISSVDTGDEPEDPEEPEAVERTLTFSDFGIDDASYNGGNYSALTGTAPADVKTLDKVTFIGKIGVTTNVDASLFFGGEYVNNAYQDDSYGIGFFNVSGELWLRYRWAGATSKEIKIISAENLSEQGLSLVGDELIWKVRFDYTDNDVKVTVTLQQGEDSVSGECTLEGIADTLKTNMAFNPWGSTCDIASAIDYVDIGFSDFDIASQVVGAGLKVSGSLEEGETLDGKHFTGRYRFSTGGDGYLGFGGSTSQNDSQGISLWTDGNGGLWARCWASATKISGDGVRITKETLSENGIDLSDTVIVECWIEYVNNDNINVTWKLSDTEGDSYEKELSYSYTGITGMLSTTLIVASSAGTNSEIEPAQPTTYTDINFASFGISSQVVGAGQKASGSLAGGETLHGKHFTGRYRFSTGGDGYLGFGGSTSQNDSQGISLWTDGNGGLWARCWASATKISGDGVQITKETLSENGIDLSDTVVVECWIEYVNNDNINVTWKLSDTEGDSYEKELSYSYTGITDMLSTTLIVASSATAASEIEPAEPTTYTDINFASFGISSQVVGAGQTVYGGLANDETLHGKHFTGRYRFSTGADGYIGFGGSTLTLDSQGISLWTDGNGGLLARCWVATKKIHDGEAISKAVLSENGIDLSKEVTVEFWVEYKDANNVNVRWKLSDEDGDSYEKDFSYTYEGITDLLSTYLIVTSSSTTDSVIEPEEPVAEGKTVVTFYDFNYIEDMTMSAGTGNAGEHIKGEATCIENFDNVTFKGTVSYETNATLSLPVLLFGGEKDSEQWTNINGAEKGFYLQLYDNGYVKMGVQRGTVNSVYTIGTAFSSGTSIDIQINFAYDEGDLRVTVYLTQGDTTIEHTARFKGAATAIGTSTWLVAAPYGAKMTIASAYTRDVTKSDDVYMLDLENPKAYLLTGKEITVNGVSKTAGDTLSESGEYTIVYMKNGVKYTQKVSIFALGDLDTNALIIDGVLKDVVNSKTLVKMKKYVKDGAPTSSTQRAADLTNDEVVDDADAVFLRKVLVGLVKLDEYYPAALSYGFVGGSDVMPIGGYYGPYAKDGYDYITDDVYKTMQDANINLVVSSPMDYMDGAESNQNLRKALALGEKYKIGMYVLDSRMNQIVPTGETAINEEPGEGYNSEYSIMERKDYITTAKEAAENLTNYSYFDSYFGTVVRDEPCTNTFPAKNVAPLNFGNHIDWYGDVATILNGYSNTFGYMNAQAYSGRPKDNPSFSTLGTVNMNYTANTSVPLYQEYLNEILTKSQVPMLSFDNYMYGLGVDGDKRTVANTNTWLVNLDTVRAVAKSNDTGKEVPFWTYVAAGGYFDGDTTTITNTDDIMTQAQFNWQVNVPLAFGTKGLTYFPLIQPSDFANADDVDSNLTRNGMINTEYETTKWYTYAQAINKQVTAIDHVLMKADSRGVIISEGTTSNAYKNMVNISYKRYGTSYYREYSVQNYTLEAYEESDPQGRVMKFTSSDTTNGAIAGVFSYQGKTAYYVVNWSDANTNNVTLTFDKASNYTVIQNAVESTGSGTNCELSLAAGEGVLVVLND